MKTVRRNRRRENPTRSLGKQSCKVIYISYITIGDAQPSAVTPKAQQASLALEGSCNSFPLTLLPVPDIGMGIVPALDESILKFFVDGRPRFPNVFSSGCLCSAYLIKPGEFIAYSLQTAASQQLKSCFKATIISWNNAIEKQIWKQSVCQIQGFSFNRSSPAVSWDAAYG